MLISEQESIKRVLSYNPITDVSDVFGLNVCYNDGDTIKQDIYIDNKAFSNSTLAIWQSKGTYCPSTKQYVKYKRINLEFQLTFCLFENPYIDYYYYTFTRCT